MKSHGNHDRTIEEEIKGIEKLLQYVYVSIEDGKILWVKKPSRKIKVGCDAGNTTNKGYTLIGFENSKYLRHRIVFYVAYGYLPLIVDHIEGVEKGDQISNLQPASVQFNTQKQKKRSTNTSGYKGVDWFPKTNKWRSRLMIDGKQKTLGYFNTPELAHEAYESKLKEILTKDKTIV